MVTSLCYQENIVTSPTPSPLPSSLLPLPSVCYGSNRILSFLSRQQGSHGESIVKGKGHGNWTLVLLSVISIALQALNVSKSLKSFPTLVHVTSYPLVFLVVLIKRRIWDLSSSFFSSLFPRLLYSELQHCLKYIMLDSCAHESLSRQP